MNKLNIVNEIIGFITASQNTALTFINLKFNILLR
jgi:hypothetical protein